MFSTPWPSIFCPSTFQFSILFLFKYSIFYITKVINLLILATRIALKWVEITQVKFLGWRTCRTWSIWYRNVKKERSKSPRNLKLQKRNILSKSAFFLTSESWAFILDSGFCHIFWSIGPQNYESKYSPERYTLIL